MLRTSLLNLISLSIAISCATLTLSSMSQAIAAARRTNLDRWHMRALPKTSECFSWNRAAFRIIQCFIESADFGAVAPDSLARRQASRLLLAAECRLNVGLDRCNCCTLHPPYTSGQSFFLKLFWCKAPLLGIMLLKRNSC